MKLEQCFRLQATRTHDCLIFASQKIRRISHHQKLMRKTSEELTDYTETVRQRFFNITPDSV